MQTIVEELYAYKKHVIESLAALKRTIEIDHTTLDTLTRLSLSKSADDLAQA